MRTPHDLEDVGFQRQRVECIGQHTANGDFGQSLMFDITNATIRTTLVMSTASYDERPIVQSAFFYFDLSDRFGRDR